MLSVQGFCINAYLSAPLGPQAPTCVFPTHASRPAKQMLAHFADAYLPVLLARELFVDDEKLWEHFVRCGHCCRSAPAGL